MKQSYDVAVIGGGPGGYTAALYCARSGYSVIVLEKLSPGGQMATTGQVDNYPGFDEGIDGFELGEKMQKGAERFGVETAFVNVTEAKLDGDIKKITTSKGEIEARAVVLATGASPRELGLAEEKMLRGRGVAYCATCDGMMYKGKTVVVVGGGNSAAADALYLSKICKKVYLVHRRDSLRASRIYLEPLKNSGIEFVWNSRVTGILHDKKVSGVIVTNNDGTVKEIACDGVFAAIGRVPDTGLFQGQVEMDKQGYLVADETTRTNLPGVFAVGDARTKPLRQIVTAAADGAVASHYIEEYLV
ncbi:thioredoxin-disulfide reductase [[Clostridium] symbiosum]|uniref:thioredoxin-disulfide reductase n=1 Tax=Clostridium symbiosum TaxID=1512 RepID=UPI001D08A564|nr:thioredoxin-disulfide reductase [[Clostridium] symbiosum]MCB6611604.1 thioredoxin-disulfide reductase [[Clostridium] symbiosum]MCB6932255.1 thioredoxin-disulfide reductase [[Clostridium] symbiosum]